MKLREETNKRLELLHNKSYKWLMSVAFNTSKDRDIAEELVAELYLYLAERPNPSIWYNDTFNLMYLRSFIQTRFINRKKVDNRTGMISDEYDKEDIPYDEERDQLWERTHNMVIEELKRMEWTRQWAPSKLAQMYFFNEGMTLEKLASEIRISKSTAFLNVKKVKKHLKEVIPNPFQK